MNDRQLEERLITISKEASDKIVAMLITFAILFIMCIAMFVIGIILYKKNEPESSKYKAGRALMYMGSSGFVVSLLIFLFGFVIF